MKIKKSFLQDLVKQRYLSYIQSLPQFKKEQTEAYLMIILVIFTILFFGIFAIMPTLSTIAELKKDLEDSTYINEQLQTKITNLSQLQQQYSILSPSLPLLLSAIPKKPQAPLLLGQVQKLAQEAGVTVTRLQAQNPLADEKKPVTKFQTFTLTVDASGTLAGIQSFYNSLVQFERIITFESMTITKNQETGLLQLSIKATAYYTP